MTLPFMGASIAFMLLALMVGILRLMAQNGIGPAAMGQLYALHPLLMVFGFIGGMIVTERIAGVELLPHTRETGLSLAIPPFIFGGMVLEAAGYLLGLSFVRYFGAGLLVISSVLFLVLLGSFFTMGRERLSVMFMFLSAFALLLSSVLSALSLPAGNVGFVMILLLFPVIFILGERVELTSLATQTSPRRFAPALLLAVLAVALFGFDAFSPAPAPGPVAAVGFAVTGVVFGFFLLAELRVHTRGTKTPFQGYVGRHVAVAYAWGILGAAFGAAYVASPGFVFYDAFVHSFALGFVGLMFLAHGPIILPMVTRRRFDNAKLSYTPLVILVLALALRIGSESALLYSRELLLELSVAGSGWLVLVAVLAFFVEIFRGTSLGAASRAPLTRDSRRSGVLGAQASREPVALSRLFEDDTSAPGPSR